MLRRYDKTRGKLYILASFYKLNASLFNDNIPTALYLKYVFIYTGS